MPYTYDSVTSWIDYEQKNTCTTAKDRYFIVFYSLTFSDKEMITDVTDILSIPVKTDKFPTRKQLIEHCKSLLPDNISPKIDVFGLIEITKEEALSWNK